MSTRLYFSLIVCCGLAGSVLSIGCDRGKETQHAEDGGVSDATNDDSYDPHDVPLTDAQKEELREQTAEFADAVKVIESLRDEIERETDAGIPESPYITHQALDKADLVLQWLPEIARGSGVPKEHWEEMNTTANDLRTLFEQVHQNIDDAQDPDFGAVAPDLRQKLGRLREIAATDETNAAKKE